MHLAEAGCGESTGTSWTADQVMFTLAWLAYDGESSTDPDTVMEALTADLETVKPLGGDWELVWGPTLFKFWVSELDDNMWYVVRNTVTGEYAIGIRGTNFEALLDWIVEDFWITSQVAWPYGDVIGSNPMIARGTAFAIDKLLSVTPAAGIPGEGQSLTQFLATEAAAGAITINVTGHSLGGCLSSTLALALQDTQDDWNPAGDATIQCWSFAGPTAGNSDFASYTDAEIGDVLHRWVNTLDVAPLAWNESTLDDALTIYASYEILPTWAEIAALGFAKLLAAGGDYLQPSCGAVTESGSFNITPGHQSYATQAAWQHSYGYAAILGLSNVLPSRASATMTPERIAARLRAMQAGAASRATQR